MAEYVPEMNWFLKYVPEYHIRANGILVISAAVHAILLSFSLKFRLYGKSLTLVATAGGTQQAAGSTKGNFLISLCQPGRHAEVHRQINIHREIPSFHCVPHTNLKTGVLAVLSSSNILDWDFHNSAGSWGVQWLLIKTRYSFCTWSKNLQTVTPAPTIF